MRFVKYDPATGEIQGWGDAGEEHFETANARGETIILLKEGDPHVFDGLVVDVASGSLRLVEKQNGS